MKPHKDNKRKRTADTAVCRYLRAKLGWLRGFPFDSSEPESVGWMVLPRLGNRSADDQRHVDRERIRQAEFARNAALRRFPQALPRLVGDVELWKQRTDAQLEILKGAVHERKPLPDLADLLSATGLRRSVRERANGIAAAGLDLKRLVVAAAWAHWGNESELRETLNLIERHQLELIGLLTRLDRPDGSRYALHCLQLLADGCPPAFLQRLSDPRCWEVPLTPGDFADRLRGGFHVENHSWERIAELAENGFPRPQPRLGTALVEYIFSLAGRSRKCRTRQLELFEALVPDALLETWDTWWTRASNLEREAIGLLSQHASIRDGGIKCSALGERIKQELGSPRAFHWRDVSETIDIISTTLPPGAYLALLKCLRSVEGCYRNRPLVQLLLDNWAAELRVPNKGWSGVTRLLNAQAKLLERSADAGEEAKVWICDMLPDDLMGTWIHDETRHNLIEPALEVVAALLDGEAECNEQWGPFADYYGWDTLVEVLTITTDTALVADVFVHMPPNRDGLHGRDFAILLELSAYKPDVFQTLLSTWKPRAWNALLMAELSRVGKDPDTSELVVEALLNGQAKRVRHLLAHLILLRVLRDEVPGAPRAGQNRVLDLEPYPATLHPLLSELAAWDADAERAADQILSKDFPRPADLKAELAFLRSGTSGGARADEDVIAARIRALEKRLKTPAQVSPHRLENHHAKLQRRVHHARFVAWEKQLTARVQAALQRKMGAVPDDAWFTGEQTVRVLAGLSDLKAGPTELAFRLIAERCGPPPWDLRSAPQNQRFLTKMDARGIHLGPWLEGIGTREHAVGPVTVSLDLECDPLEVFRMGEPFQTCLSPGGFCFYSTIANAADLNKRVLYARDENGTIQGRCLLALTDQGNLLTFHVYAHDHHQEMEAAVRSFVLELAAQMGTVSDTKGRVSVLVASNWLDDGPNDLMGTTQWLEDGSKFCKSLGRINPEGLVQALEKELRGQPITAAIVCELSCDEAFEARPQLIVPLLPYLHDIAAMDPWSSLRLLPIIRAAGETEAAMSLLEKIHPLLLHGDFIQSSVPVTAAREWTALEQPHKALRLLRRTRPADVRDWESEWTERAIVAAIAMAQLYRPRQALTLCRIVRSDGSDELRALEVELEAWLEQDASAPH